jgi:heparanase
MDASDYRAARSESDGAAFRLVASIDLVVLNWLYLRYGRIKLPSHRRPRRLIRTGLAAAIPRGPGDAMNPEAFSLVFAGQVTGAADREPPRFPPAPEAAARLAIARPLEGCFRLWKDHRPALRHHSPTRSGLMALRSLANPRRGRAAAISFVVDRLCCCLIAAWPAIPAYAGALTDAPQVAPSSLRAVGTVDARFQSYNIEMIEITGGRFWKPYRSKQDARRAPPPRIESDTPPGMDSNLYQYRPPIDLGRARLRKLAAALGPSYLRVSGTWANTTYFSDSDTAPAAPPAGFSGTLTRPQWRSVVDFAQNTDAKIVTSFAIGPGARDAAGVWQPDQARRLLGYTASVGGTITAAEFMNEPNLAAIGGAPDGYDAGAYGRDFKIFRAFLRQAAPGVMILGPGTVGETAIASDLLAASGPGVDGLSYHYYGALSERCGGHRGPAAALSEAWLSQTERTLKFYSTLRDRFAPGKPIWLTETAEAACGGDRWAATFLDTFRYLDQLGRLAKAGVQVVMHNTLAASDYGLLDENTLQPRPNYWGAWLWRQLMGTTVLDAGVPLRSGLHVYAHCQRGTTGGVVVLVINPDRNAPHSLRLATASVRYTLAAASPGDAEVRLNGRALRLGDDDRLPALAGVPATADRVTFAPATISFLAVPAAANQACR